MSVTLVTGAAGHLGANLVRALLREGRRVRALVRSDARALEGLELELVHGDVTAPDTLTPAMRHVDVVFHLAGLITLRGDDDERATAVNVDGVRHVARAALDAGVRRFIHFSSVEAEDTASDGEPTPTGHERPSSPFGAYGRSKAQGDAVVASFVARGLPAITLRPSGVLGPFDFKPSLMGRFLIGLHQRRFPVLVAGAFDWVDARDVAETAVRAERAGPIGERYLVTGTWASLTELARAAGEVAGFHPPTRVVPSWLARLGAHLIEAGSAIVGAEPLWTPGALARVAGGAPFDGARARAELGHRARPLRETLRDAYAWYRSVGMLPAPSDHRDDAHDDL